MQEFNRILNGCKDLNDRYIQPVFTADDSPVPVQGVYLLNAHDDFQLQLHDVVFF
jgi:hypothetical protein